MAKKPEPVFDGWRLDIDPVWESYNRIFFSYKRSELEKEIYLRRLYRSHFVVFAYSFIDGVVSKILIQEFKITKTQLREMKDLRLKVEQLHNQNVKVAALDAYDHFWRDIEWLRNELIHPSRDDHAAAIELDKLDVENRMARLNSFAVRSFEIATLEFPYWLTGWNFVNSMTSSSANDGITRISNSQFKVFLQGHGWTDRRYRFQALETVENYLVGEDMYKAVMSFLNKLDFETQPLPDDIGYSLMPLWSREWWDKQAMENLRTLRMSKSPFRGEGRK